MTCSPPLVQDIRDLREKLNLRMNYEYQLLLSLREACDAYLGGVLTLNELQSRLCTNYSLLDLDTMLRQYSAKIEMRCRNI
jgi:hypothetical protein